MDDRTLFMLRMIYQNKKRIGEVEENGKWCADEEMKRGIMEKLQERRKSLFQRTMKLGHTEETIKQMLDDEQLNFALEDINQERQQTCYHYAQNFQEKLRANQSDWPDDPECVKKIFCADCSMYQKMTQKQQIRSEAIEDIDTGIELLTQEQMDRWVEMMDGDGE